MAGSGLKPGRQTGELAEGEELTPLDFTLSPEVVGYTCIAFGDRHAWYTEDSPFGGRIVPPADAFFSSQRQIVNHLVGELWGGVAEDPALVFARFDARYFNPAKVGETVRITGRCAKRYRKRGRNFIDFEHKIHGADGRLIAEFNPSFAIGYRKQGD